MRNHIWTLSDRLLVKRQKGITTDLVHAQLAPLAFKMTIYMTLPHITQSLDTMSCSRTSLLANWLSEITKKVIFLRGRQDDTCPYTQNEELLTSVLWRCHNVSVKTA